MRRKYPEITKRVGEKERSAGALRSCLRHRRFRQGRAGTFRYRDDETVEVHRWVNDVQ